MSGLKKTGALTVFTPPYGVVCQYCVIEAVLSGQYCSTLRATFWVTLVEQGMGSFSRVLPSAKIAASDITAYRPASCRHFHFPGLS